MLKKFASKAAADKSTGGVTFSPARPELLSAVLIRWATLRMLSR